MFIYDFALIFSRMMICEDYLVCDVHGQMLCSVLSATELLCSCMPEPDETDEEKHHPCHCCLTSVGVSRRPIGLGFARGALSAFLSDQQRKSCLITFWSFYFFRSQFWRNLVMFLVISWPFSVFTQEQVSGFLERIVCYEQRTHHQDLLLVEVQRDSVGIFFWNEIQ
jgi:hypothetical protein